MTALGAVVCIALGLFSGFSLFTMGAAVERHARQREVAALRAATEQALDQAKRVVESYGPVGGAKPQAPPNKVTKDGDTKARPKGRWR